MWQGRPRKSCLWQVLSGAGELEAKLRVSRFENTLPCYMAKENQAHVALGLCRIKAD